jgi:dipeptidyl aminopeptidase/acylaminoacyl peptidase
MIGSPERALLERICDYTFASALTTAGSRIAWLTNRAGRRSVLTAEAPAFRPRLVVGFDEDDGQELSSLSLSADGAWAVFVRGGDYGGNWERARAVQPASAPLPEAVSLWSASTTGDAIHRLADGDDPVIVGDRVLFPRGEALWQVPIDGSGEPTAMFSVRGGVAQVTPSPDGTRLAFVADRGSHSLIGLFEGEGRPIRWLAPGVTRDTMPRWSPDGRRIAFVRLAATPPVTYPGPSRFYEVGSRFLWAYRPRPWSVWVADAATGEAEAWWTSGRELRDSVEDRRPFLDWTAGDRLCFLAGHEGWRHLFSVSGPGAEAIALTSGDFSVDDVAVDEGRTHLLVSANGGDEEGDVERRHLFRVAADRADAVAITSGTGLEWTPLPVVGVTAFLSATATRPPQPAVLEAGAVRLIEQPGAVEYAADRLVVPRSVAFAAEDGVTVHGQLFAPFAATATRAAALFIHGGPGPQQRLGWHAHDYYAHCYALNQYLAARGFVVLAVNYRSDQSYGFDYQFAPEVGPHGAAEYRDIRAAGRFLASLDGVDADRIGVFGGSYGGYLTAMALAHDSDLFAVGVDVHGVHDWGAHYDLPAVLPRLPHDLAADADRVLDLAWRSSPMSAVAGWRSPVLLISGDDDRNVDFVQTVELARRLDEADVVFEHLAIPDETHSFLVHRNLLAASAATAEFLERHLTTGAHR